MAVTWNEVVIPLVRWTGFPGVVFSIKQSTRDWLEIALCETDSISDSFQSDTVRDR